MENLLDLYFNTTIKDLNLFINEIGFLKIGNKIMFYNFTIEKKLYEISYE